MIILEHDAQIRFEFVLKGHSTNFTHENQFSSHGVLNTILSLEEYMKIKITLMMS